MNNSSNACSGENSQSNKEDNFIYIKWAETNEGLI